MSSQLRVIVIFLSERSIIVPHTVPFRLPIINLRGSEEPCGSHLTRKSAKTNKNSYVVSLSSSCALGLDDWWMNAWTPSRTVILILSSEFSIVALVQTSNLTLLIYLTLLTSLIINTTKDTAHNVGWNFKDYVDIYC